MKSFDEVMQEVAKCISHELFNELQEAIEQESVDSYNAGYEEGVQNTDAYDNGYDIGYEDGKNDKD